MPGFLILRELGLIVGAAAGLSIVARRLGFPPLLACMVVGLLLGPATGLVHLTEDIELVSELGIALLLFLVGLELNVAIVRHVGQAALRAGTGQAVLTGVGGLVLTLLLGFPLADAIVLGIATTFSSTMVAVKLLEERRELDTVHGRIALGVLLLQDLIAVVALSALSAVGGGDGESGGLLPRLARALVGGALLSTAAVLLAVRVLPGVFRWLSQRPEALFVCSLAWCFVFMVAAARLGLSLEIGAFVAGVGLAQLPWNEELRRRVHPLASFFVAVFFVSLGLQLELSGVMRNLLAIVLLTVFVLLVKPGILSGLLARMRFSASTAFMAPLALAQVSEFSLIFGALAHDRRLIGDDAVTVLGMLMLLTSAISATALQNGDGLYAWFRRTPLARLLPDAPEPPEREPHAGHIIVVGMNTLGRMLVRQLAARGEDVFAIDTDPSKLTDLPATCVTANAMHGSVLEELHLAHAKLLISALQIEDMNNLLAYRCRMAGVPCAIHAFDTQLAPDLRELGVDYIMVSKHDGIRQMVGELRQAGVIE